MANSGPDTNGSQFFLTLAPVNRLNYLHSVFGRTVSGLEVLNRIEPGDTMTVKIIRRGRVALDFRADEKNFAALNLVAPRARPLAFADPDGLLQTDPARAATLNTKLENLKRFTTISLFARLYEKIDGGLPFTPESLRASLQLKNKDVLVVWVAAENQWHLSAPAYPDLKLPPISPPPAASNTLSAEQRVLDAKRRLFTVVNEMVDSLIFQLESYQRTVRLVKPAPAPRITSLASEALLQQNVKPEPSATLPQIIRAFPLETFILCNS
jgi:hypothetical protein